MVPAIIGGAVVVTLTPLLVDPRLREPRPVLGTMFAGIACLAVALGRRAPIVAVGAGVCALLSSAISGEAGPEFWAVPFAVVGLSGIAGSQLTGRRSYAAGAVVLVSANLGAWIVQDTGPALTMLVVAGFVAGRVVGERQQTAEALAERSRELEEEQDLLADLSVRYERARIAAELHDIVGHAISVMVVQAAAGQRLVEQGPEAASKAFSVIADAARQGSEDLNRLVALLGGDEGRIESPDVDLVDELVQRAAASGLDVTCRFEGDRGGIPPEAAQAAFRVVQEGLTNALRHAPGSSVEIVVRSDDANGRGLVVRVENGAQGVDRQLVPAGTGTGLRGLRERVQSVGGTCVAGPSDAGGWLLEASFPAYESGGV